MDLRQIENILAIEQEQSISKASQKLYITQSALNQQLLKLEKELGTPLFERKNHLMIPTYAGQIYLDNARKMLELKESTYKVIRDISEENTGEISVAFTPEKGAQMFTDLYPIFHSRYPNIRFQIREARVKGMEQLVLQKEVSFAVSTSAPGLKDPQLKYVDIHKERVFLIVPVSNPLSELAGGRSFEDPKQIDIRLFKDDSFVMPSKETRLRELVDRILKNNAMRINPLFESSNTGTVVRMVQNQICNGFVPEAYVKPNDSIVYFLPTPEEYWHRSIIMRPDTYITKAEQYFLDLVKLASTNRLPGQFNA